MPLNKEIDLLEQHSRTMCLVIANLVATSEELSALSDDVQRQRLLSLQQQAIDAAGQSLELSRSALAHLRKLEGLCVPGASRSVA
jgi:hypothetical protein